MTAQIPAGMKGYSLQWESANRPLEQCAFLKARMDGTGPPWRRLHAIARYDPLKWTHTNPTPKKTCFFSTCFQLDELFSLLLHWVSAVCEQLVVFLHCSYSQSQYSCGTVKLQPEFLVFVLYGERCLCNSLSRKPWKSISTGCAAGMIDSSSSKTKERGLHIYVNVSPVPAVDSLLWSSMDMFGKGSDNTPQRRFWLIPGKLWF